MNDEETQRGESEAAAEELPHEEIEAVAIEDDDDGRAKRWRELMEATGQIKDLTAEVRLSNQRSAEQATSIASLVESSQRLTETNQELAQRLRETLSTREASGEQQPHQEPESQGDPPERSEPKPSESDSPKKPENEPSSAEPEPHPEPERQPRHRRSI